jgi:hypothetical protein
MGSYAVEIQVVKGARFTRNWRRFTTEVQALDYAGSRQTSAHVTMYMIVDRPNAVRVVTTNDAANTDCVDHDAYWRETYDN